MRRNLVVLLAIGLVVVMATIASAGSLIDTTVTIKTENGDFWGYVKSPRPKKCAKDRKVVLFKQLGAEQDPANDDRVASDTAERSGDRYTWSTGNTGVYGKFYARVARTSACAGDTSPTVRSVRPA